MVGLQKNGKREIGSGQNRNPSRSFAAKGSKEMLWQLMEYVESRAEFYFFKIGEVMACLHDDNGINGAGIKTLIK